MTKNKERGYISSSFHSISDSFSVTKPRPPALQKALFDSQSAVTAVPPVQDPIPSKRKATTSAPSSPISARPQGKRRAILDFFKKTITAPVSFLSPPPPSTPPSLFQQDTVIHKKPPSSAPNEANIPDEEDLGSASDRSPSSCWSCPSTDSLARRHSDAWAPRARARDPADVNRVLRTIRQVKENKYIVKKGGPGGKYLIQRVLHHSGYRLLWEELKKEGNEELLKYVTGDRFRFDYLRRPAPGDKQFVVHMPSTFHETMAGMFSEEIIERLISIRKGEFCTVDSTKEETKKVAKKIRSTLATRVECNEPRDDRLEPDLSYTHEDCSVPDLLVEVAWSQSSLKLPFRAMRYIEGKSGKIRTVVGLNMNDIYQGGCKATFSIWKAQLVGDKWSRVTVVEDQEFIDKDGQAVKNCVMRLSLRDFVCEQRERKLKEFEDVPLEISSTKLHDLFKEAFRKHVMAEVEKAMGEIINKADEALGNIVRAKERIKKNDDSSREPLVRATEGRAEIRRIMFRVERDILQLKNSMSDVKKKMDKVDKEMDNAEEMKVEAEKKLTEVEKQMTRLKAEEEKLAGTQTEGAPDSEEISPAGVVPEAAGEEDMDGAGPSQPQPSMTRRGSRFKLRLRPRRSPKL